MSKRGNPNRRLTEEQIKAAHKKNKTLIIEYDDYVRKQERVEGHRNVSDPGKILSKRNLIRVNKVTYMGEVYDISKHLAAYAKKTIKQIDDAIKTSEAAEAGSKK
jgi:hypothetical protein